MLAGLAAGGAQRSDAIHGAYLALLEKPLGQFIARVVEGTQPAVLLMHVEHGERWARRWTRVRAAGKGPGYSPPARYLVCCIVVGLARQGAVVHAAQGKGKEGQP